VNSIIAATLAALISTVPASPEALFASGDFPGAAAAARATLANTPNDPASLLVAGTVAVYENRLAEASGYLHAVLKNDSANPIAARLLAEIERRTTLARHGDITFGPARDVVPFVTTDPIPVIAMMVNGRRGLFQIDTGAPGVSVDRDFAREIGLPQRPGTHAGIFANGVPQTIPETEIDTLGLGNSTLRGIAADVLPLRAMSNGMYPEGQRIDGAIGTSVFERFSAVTIDYAAGSLVLYAPGATLPPDAGTPVPLWLVGDHFLITRGEIASQTGAIAIDTGLAGGGVVPSEQTVRAAKLALGASGMGQTPGGEAPISSVLVPEVGIGTALERNVRGFVSPAAEHSPFRFATAGTVGHEFFRHRALTIDFEHMQLKISDRAS
jgi:predicted aspartyl protease